MIKVHIYIRFMLILILAAGIGYGCGLTFEDTSATNTMNNLPDEQLVTLSGTVKVHIDTMPNLLPYSGVIVAIFESSWQEFASERGLPAKADDPPANAFPLGVLEFEKYFAARSTTNDDGSYSIRVPKGNIRLCVGPEDPSVSILLKISACYLGRAVESGDENVNLSQGFGGLRREP